MKLESSFNLRNREQLLIAKSQTCSTCTEWLKECDAECCSIIHFDMPAIALKHVKEFVIIKKHCDPDQIWYYKLRGVRYIHGDLLFPKKRFIVMAGKCVYINRCELLTDDNLCTGHPDKKPKMCKVLDLDLVLSGKTKSEHIYVTPNCLFKYKAMDVGKL